VGGGGALQGEQGAVFEVGEGADVGEGSGDVWQIDGAAGGIDYQEEALVAEIGDHEVVDDAASLVEQEGVALAAGLDADDVAGDKALEHGGGSGPGEHGLAHVGDVEQGGVGAAVQVLGDDAAAAARGERGREVVLHGH
jgi:predicted pyridoxine 5'-phosphate oxidase superfamily flavin-nucleotide-binding protein